MGHDPGSFRLWWRALIGSDETLDNTHLMRMAAVSARRIRGYTKAKDIPAVDCPVGERKHGLAGRISDRDGYRSLPSDLRDVFLVK
jgi:hypothetical protein